jgi:hypothetical protein
MGRGARPRLRRNTPRQAPVTVWDQAQERLADPQTLADLRAAHPQPGPRSVGAVRALLRRPGNGY